MAYPLEVPLDSEKFAKNWKKEGENKSGQKRDKIRKKSKNREGSFTLPLLTDRAGYTTVNQPSTDPDLFIKLYN